MIRNFYPGPCALPASVLARIRDDLPDYDGTGMSVLEISHRAPPVIELMQETAAGLKRLLGLDESFEVLLLQGGATLQFAMVPLNFSHPGDKVDYADTGIWAGRAAEEARRLGRDVGLVASGAPDYAALPTRIETRPGTRFLHMCSNNTIVGTQFAAFPQVPVPLMVDASSDILSMERDHTGLGCLYAHAQKSFGAAGVTIVALRRDLPEGGTDGLPSMLDYRVHMEHRSAYNTPPVFSIYLVRLMLDWLENEIGGVAAMERVNRIKAGLLYDVIDGSDFYSGPVEPASRSLMNVVFRLPSPELDARFVAEAEENGLMGLAGHRHWKGCRASLYNAVTVEDVQVLADFMRDFERRRA